MSDKKTKQLGMNPSTASGRLVKDLLWNFVKTTGQDACCKCGEPMSRDTFSIEHVTPWLDSDDPVGLYFDIDNIGYSHHRCNVGSARQRESRHGTKNMYAKHGCRCDPCKAAKACEMASRYTPDARREKYLRTGN
ncbi:hypothetical protein vBPFY1MI_30 [Pseudomonas phage vB_PF_Y1-MI]|nr:hypothetical protein vBPFY1MI_30 [Pseudomonas phage vB_PF_Y1-MI]